MNASDSFLSAGPPQREPSRPRSVNPQTGHEQSWQRASNYAMPLEDAFGIKTWEQRELVKGLSMRPDLARMLLTGAVIEDNAKADELIAQALSAVAIEAKANEGTAVHAALTRSFLGHETPVEYAPHIRAFADELRRNGLTPVATEVHTLCVKLGVEGHTDWVVKTADGRYLILDVKTGKLRDGRKFAVQCKAYAGAEYIDDGKGGWVPIPFELDQTEAILAHVDPETGATSLYRVDLVLGFYGASLAERVRDWGKINVLGPYTPVHPSIPQRVEVVRTQLPERVQHVGERDSSGLPGSERVTAQYAAAHPGLYNSDGTAIPASPANEVVGPIEVTEPRPPSAQNVVHPVDPSAPLGHPDNAETRAQMGEGVQQVRDKLTRDELLKPSNDKPKLQALAKSLGLTDLAHNRAWLADWIIAKQSGANDEFCVMYAKSKGTLALGPDRSGSPMTVAQAAAATAPEQTVEAPPDDLSFIFKSIEGAKSEGALEALRANVVERRGDQAWTDQMAEAARVKVLQLLAADGNAVGPAERTLARIAQATEPQHIALLWSEVTVGGSAPENWTEPLKLAADRRLAEIQQAHGAPPANPYGPQA